MKAMTLGAIKDRRFSQRRRRARTEEKVVDLLRKFLNSRESCELRMLIDLAGTAAWREQKAAQFPEDLRNARAVVLMKLLENQLIAFEGSAMHSQLLALCSIKQGYLEAIEDSLRAIGFGWTPRDATDLLRGVEASLICLPHRNQEEIGG